MTEDGQRDYLPLSWILFVRVLPMPACERDPPSATRLRQLTNHALVLAAVASSAYGSGMNRWAGMLHAAAERSCCMVLTGIAKLTDDEADQLEPGVSRIENHFLDGLPHGGERQR